MFNLIKFFLIVCVVSCSSILVLLIKPKIPSAAEATEENVRKWKYYGTYDTSIGFNAFSLPLTEAGARDADMNYLTCVIYETPDFRVGFSKSGNQTFFIEKSQLPSSKITLACLVGLVSAFGSLVITILFSKKYKSRNERNGP
jgi:hypothetical protein